MPHPFLSEPWFDEVEQLRDEMPSVPGADDLTLNIVVTGGPEGDKEVHLTNGSFERGLVDGAPTKVFVPFDVARSMFIDQNTAAVMQAFMGGQIKIEGDMTKLMAMQAQVGASPSPEQAAFANKLKEITA